MTPEVNADRERTPEQNRQSGLDAISEEYRDEVDSAINLVRAYREEYGDTEDVDGAKRQKLRSVVEMMRHLKLILTNPHDYVRARKAVNNLGSDSLGMRVDAFKTLQELKHLHVGLIRSTLLGLDDNTGIRSNDNRERLTASESLYGNTAPVVLREVRKVFLKQNEEDFHFACGLLAIFSPVDDEREVAWIKDGGFLEKPVAAEFLARTVIDEFAGKSCFDYLFKIAEESSEYLHCNLTIAAINLRLKNLSDASRLEEVIETAVSLANSESSSESLRAGAIKVLSTCVKVKEEQNCPDTDKEALSERVDNLCLHIFYNTHIDSEERIAAVKAISIEKLPDIMTVLKTSISNQSHSVTIGTVLDRTSDIYSEEVDSFRIAVIEGWPYEEEGVKALKMLIPEELSDDDFKQRASKYLDLLKKRIKASGSEELIEYATRQILRADRKHLNFIVRTLKEDLFFPSCSSGIAAATADLQDKRIERTLVAALKFDAPLIKKPIQVLEQSTDPGVKKALIGIIRQAHRVHTTSSSDERVRVKNCTSILAKNPDKEVQLAFCRYLSKKPLEEVAALMHPALRPAEHPELIHPLIKLLKAPYGEPGPKAAVYALSDSRLKELVSERYFKELQKSKPSYNFCNNLAETLNMQLSLSPDETTEERLCKLFTSSNSDAALTSLRVALEGHINERVISTMLLALKGTEPQRRSALDFLTDHAAVDTKLNGFRAKVIEALIASDDEECREAAGEI